MSDSFTAATVIVIWRFVTFYWYLIVGALLMLYLGARETRPLMS